MIMNYLLFQCNQPLQGWCTILGSWTVVFFAFFFFFHAVEMREPTNILELLDCKQPNCSSVFESPLFLATVHFGKYIFFYLPKWNIISFTRIPPRQTVGHSDIFLANRSIEKSKRRKRGADKNVYVFGTMFLHYMRTTEMSSCPSLPSGARPTYQNLGNVSRWESSSRSCYTWPNLPLALSFFLPSDAWPNFKPPAVVTHGSAPKRSASWSHRLNWGLGGGCGSSCCCKRENESLTVNRGEKWESVKIQPQPIIFSGKKKKKTEKNGAFIFWKPFESTSKIFSAPWKCCFFFVSLSLSSQCALPVY